MVLFQFLPNEPSALESPELLARCALDATGPSNSCPLTDCNQINGTGYETLTEKQRILRLVLDSVLEVAQPEHRGQILNFRKSVTDPVIGKPGRLSLSLRVMIYEQFVLSVVENAYFQLEDCRPERKVKLSPIQLAACSFDCRRLLSVFLSNLNMKQLDVIAELKEQFHYGNNLISVSDKLNASFKEICEDRNTARGKEDNAILGHLSILFGTGSFVDLHL
ncbi:hypothetical protein FGIG_04487 [Fasciola gigantica]|uniref:Uncharacterized protein n=1 Tax=Fasciola gigantica TaxID=46835 RepID=A0A504Y5Z9_FASGI|nr:hypothetical protein FGIG_04487 [Fasciola gigantica]